MRGPILSASFQAWPNLLDRSPDGAAPAWPSWRGLWPPLLCRRCICCRCYWYVFRVLLWLIEGSRSWWQAFRDGWWFGFGHFIAGFYWIGLSLLVDAAQYAWLYPFAVTCIPAVLALYIGVVAVLTRLARPGPATVYSAGSFVDVDRSLARRSLHRLSVE